MPAARPLSTDPSAPFHLTRRGLLHGAAVTAGAALIGALPGGASAEAATAPLGRQMRERLTTWLALLDPAQRDRASFAFDSRMRRRWNYMLGSSFANGLALEQMTAPQKDAARDVLATALSAYGLETAENIMLQQDILRDEWGKGRPDRNRERFSLQVYGAPSATAPWSWRWEGHHLTITFTLIGDEIVAQTPKAFSSEPNTVPSGPHKGLVVLPNETLGRRLIGDLSGGARRAATIRERSFGNILAKPGREDAIAAREGVPLADLAEPQADIVRELVALYTSDHLAGPAAAVQKARIAAEDDAAIRFGWAGPVADSDDSVYYRIHGQSFLIEFATLWRQPLHHHTVVHDLARNFGDHALG